jgi:(2Fe-2S) ferredoxin
MRYIPGMAKPLRHVLVCLNQRAPGNPKGSCAEKGSEALLTELKERVAAAGLKDGVMVVGTRCLKHCSRGATVAVYPENVWYAGVKPADLAELLESHLRDGRPLERLLMPDIPWE